MGSIYEQARFLLSAPRAALAPPDVGYEVAFAGRSNAGKSSAINTITRRKSLARISKTPGRTQQLNFFQLDEMRRLVDLPGYGYAKVPASIQRRWRQAMENYLGRRKSLRGVFLVMDIRHPLTEYDQRMIAWCEQLKRPLHIALTKADKMRSGAAKNALLKVGCALEGNNAIASVQLFSAQTKTGVENSRQVLDKWLWVDEQY